MGNLIFHTLEIDKGIDIFFQRNIIGARYGEIRQIDKEITCEIVEIMSFGLVFFFFLENKKKNFGFTTIIVLKCDNLSETSITFYKLTAL